MDADPDERSTRTAEESVSEVRRGRASATPFALVGGVAAVVWGIAAVVIAVVVLLWIFL